MFFFLVSMLLSGAIYLVMNNIYFRGYNIKVLYSSIYFVVYLHLHAYGLICTSKVCIYILLFQTNNRLRTSKGILHVSAPVCTVSSCRKPWAFGRFVFVYKCVLVIKCLLGHTQQNFCSSYKYDHALDQVLYTVYVYMWYKNACKFWF